MVLIDAHLSGTGAQFVSDCNVSPHNWPPFAVAFWEAIFNADCSNGSGDNCATSGFNWGTQIGWNTRFHGRQMMLSSLLYALKISSSTTTFAQVAQNMRSYLVAYAGTTVASNVRAVFNHHGIAM